MIVIVYIILAVIGVAAMAYAIVNVIPKKLHWILSLVFLALIVYLSSLIYGGIMKPIKFAKEKKVRYAKVIDHLKMIKDAEIAHRKIAGGYEANPNNLVKFVDTAKFAITQVRTEEYTVKSGTLDLVKERRVVDTVGYRPVIEDFKGRNYKDMFKVPGTDAQFEIVVDSLDKGGITSQVFRARVAKDKVLHGMDQKLIDQEKKSLGGIEVKGEYISVGSLSNVKVAGNWPPFYDNKDNESKE